MGLHMGNELDTCWERNNCSINKKEECLVYTKGTGRYCLFNFCIIEEGKYCHKYGGCISCPWFLKTEYLKDVGNNEILNSISPIIIK